MNSVKIRIRNIAVGGDGVGEVYEILSSEDYDEDLLGITAFVPYTAPGDEVIANVLERKDRFIRAEVSEVIVPSSIRTDPQCKHYMTCGGCDLQHIKYLEQPNIKREIVVGSLRAARLPQQVIDQVEFTEPHIGYRYRRRVHLHVNSRGHVGFYQNKTRSVVPLEECPIARAEIEGAIIQCRELGSQICGKINGIIVESDGTEVTLCFIAPYGLNHQEVQEISREAGKAFRNFIIMAAGEEVCRQGKGSITLPLNKSASLKMEIPPGSFSQVNWDVNLELIEYVTGKVKSNSPEAILDLYAGAGNFSIPLAATKTPTRAVETDPRLCSLARKNAEALGLSNYLSVHESSVEKFLQSNKTQKQNEMLVLDPPRSGVGSLLSTLKNWDNIILISCSISSFVRDIKNYTEAGFSTESIQLFDMFPQTSHLEIVTHLRKE